MRRATTALLLTLPALVAAGCGGDEETEATPRPPELTVPETEPEEATAETQPAAPAEPPPADPQPPQDDGGAGAPPPPQPDSPENDQPPPAGSPAERFERFCDENPGACG